MINKRMIYPRIYEPDSDPDNASPALVPIQAKDTNPKGAEFLLIFDSATFDGV
jgi:hypothetical protein